MHSTLDGRGLKHTVVNQLRAHAGSRAAVVVA